MSNLHTLALLPALLVLAPISLGHSDDVIDVGTFHSETASVGPEFFGGKAGNLLKAEEFVFSDRQQFAPTNKPLFVIAADQKCYRGQFHRSESDDIKGLAMYYDSPVALSKCIYQKKFIEEASGFSLFAVGGGVCKPTYATTLDELTKRNSIKSVEKIVAINHCTKDTLSLGESLEQIATTKKVSRTVSAAPTATAVPTPVASPTASPVTTAVTAPQKIVAAPSVKPVENPKPVAKHDIKPVVIAQIKPVHYKYTIQVASSVNPKDAEDKRQEMSALQIGDAFVLEAMIDNRKYFRVCISKFETGAEARSFLSKNAEAIESPKAFVQVLSDK